MQKTASAALVLSTTLVLSASPAFSQQGNWLSGDWYPTVGAEVLTAPDYEGASDYMVRAAPLISLGKAGSARRFSSRNDNISLGFIDTGDFRAGPTGNIVFGRDADDSPDLAGLDPVRWGVELGAFAEFYPSDWMRLRGEVRHGIRAHDGVVADFAADAFMDVTPSIRVSGGPRLSFASADYFDAYYGVSPAESAASGLAVYDPDSGVRSVGLGGAITWKATDTVTTSLFGEYSRLMGPAADSSLVKQRGEENQFLLGVSATYRFDFSM